MKRTTRTRVTVETERLLVVSRLAHQGWCETCLADVRLASVAEAAALAGLSQRTLFRRIESGLVHSAETSGGALLVCINSLLENS